MRLKQSNKLNNKLYLPPLQRIQSNQITPKSQYTNHSLPKIPPPDLSPIEHNMIVNQNKAHIKRKRSIYDKFKALHKKRNDYSQFSTMQNKIICQPIEEASINRQFQKEIQRNLLEIKKSKESYRKGTKEQTPQRYEHSSKHAKVQDKHKAQSHLRLATQESIFSKINSIIVSPKNYDSCLKQTPTTQNIYNRQSHKKIKTEALQEQTKRQCRIKHSDNFNQWRKLSIDSLSDQKVQYDRSSFQIQSERVQRMRNKNETSMVEYMKSKKYLQKLISYRQSAMILRKKL